jgi:hypothetical protein
MYVEPKVKTIVDHWTGVWLLLTDMQNDKNLNLTMDMENEIRQLSWKRLEVPSLDKEYIALIERHI